MNFVGKIPSCVSDGFNRIPNEYLMVKWPFVSLTSRARQGKKNPPSAASEPKWNHLIDYLTWTLWEKLRHLISVTKFVSDIQTWYGRRWLVNHGQRAEQWRTMAPPLAAGCRSNAQRCRYSVKWTLLKKCQRWIGQRRFEVNVTLKRWNDALWDAPAPRVTPASAASIGATCSLATRINNETTFNCENISMEEEGGREGGREEGGRKEGDQHGFSFYHWSDHELSYTEITQDKINSTNISTETDTNFERDFKANPAVNRPLYNHHTGQMPEINRLSSLIMDVDGFPTPSQSKRAIFPK